MRRSVMRRCLKGLGGFPTSTDGFILGPSHGTVGRLCCFNADCVGRALLPANSIHKHSSLKHPRPRAKSKETQPTLRCHPDDLIPNHVIPTLAIPDPVTPNPVTPNDVTPNPVIPNVRVFHRGGGISVLTAVERQPKRLPNCVCTTIPARLIQ